MMFYLCSKYFLNMSLPERIVDYLRNVEVTEPQLIKIYTDFARKFHTEGFEEGCEFIRGIIRRQKWHRRKLLANKYNSFLTKLDDYLHNV